MDGKLAVQSLDIPASPVIFHAMPSSFATLRRNSTMERAGFRFGARGTHGSRTIMLRELAELFAAVPPQATRDDYKTAIVDQNALGKATYATRSSSRQRLTEMYGLDPRLAIFRVLRHLWRIDRDGRPLLAILTALARDPLLRSTASPVLTLAPGDELTRSRFASVIRAAVGTRMNDAVLDKVARNAASSWAQAGHLEGRVRKIRRRINPTPAAAAMALWLGQLEGRAGLSLLDSDWAAVLDAPGRALLPAALNAKRLGLIHARVAGNVVEIDTRMLDPGMNL
ncbi:MAG: hypothetical protein OXH49_07610 [Gemmatimonadetes bacterium]|nr:hypothetical protein [Gemmatimonadota bacterium]